MKLPAKAKKARYRSPEYDRVQEEYDAKYGPRGLSEAEMTSRQIQTKNKIRFWIDEQNNMRRKPEEPKMEGEYKHHSGKVRGK